LTSTSSARHWSTILMSPTMSTALASARCRWKVAATGDGETNGVGGVDAVGEVDEVDEADEVGSSTAARLARWRLKEEAALP
jgi:hypothetical protein